MIELPHDVVSHIYSFICPMTYSLLPWIDEKKLDTTLLDMILQPNRNNDFIKTTTEYRLYHHLSDRRFLNMLVVQSRFVNIIEKNLNLLGVDQWWRICRNPDAIHIIEQNMDKVDKYFCWIHLCKNENALGILEKNIDKIQWMSLVHNKNDKVLKLFEDNLNRLDDMAWSELSASPRFVSIIRKHLDKVDWRMLSKNSGAVDILEKHIEESSKNGTSCKVCWMMLSINTGAVKILEKHIEESKRNGTRCKVNWYYLSKNSGVMGILEKNIDKIQWSALSMNKSIYKADVKAYKKRLKYIL